MNFLNKAVGNNYKICLSTTIACERLYGCTPDILADANYHVIVAEKDSTLISSYIMAAIPNITNGLRSYAIIENAVTDAAFRKQGYVSGCLNF